MSDSPQTNTGTQEATARVVSGGGSGEPTSAPLTAADVRNLLSEWKEKELLPEVGRLFQSTKDRRISKIEQQLTGLESQLKELGISPDDARRVLLLNDLMLEHNSQAAPTPAATPAPVVDPWTAAGEGLLAKFSVKPDDPGLIAALGPEKDPRKRYDLITEYVAKAAKPASSSQFVPEGTGRATNPTQEALRKEFEEKLLPLRGNIAAITNLKNEYRRKGLPIY